MAFEIKNPTLKNIIDFLKNQDDRVYIKTITGHNSTNATYNDQNIESDMIPIAMDLSNPKAALSDWTITTSDGSFTISGSINGSTNITLYFMKSR